VSRLQQSLLRKISQANRRFTLIEPGDRIMVAISGGKDSWGLLHLLREYRKVLPFDFTMVAVNLDQGHPGFPQQVLREEKDLAAFAAEQRFPMLRTIGSEVV
jgi:tRNA 2-thiocytidine biosynthesis protein TtcA